MTLKDIGVGKSAKVIKINSNDEKFKIRMTDMGFVPGCIVNVKRVAPLGDPIQVSLHGYELSLGKSEAGSIEVEL